MTPTAEIEQAFVLSGPKRGKVVQLTGDETVIQPHNGEPHNGARQSNEIVDETVPDELTDEDMALINPALDELIGKFDRLSAEIQAATAELKKAL